MVDERRHEDRIVREVARRIGTADLEPARMPAAA
jgi:hypothetical protein